MAELDPSVHFDRFHFSAGAPSNSFRSKRGLRQGCPLSPLLFNLMGEALNGVLQKAVTLSLLQGIKVGQSSLRVSHLQFADNLEIFLEANIAMVGNIKRVLRVFELAFGLSLNMSKSKMYGIGVDESQCSKWVAFLKCGADSFLTKYLGLPLEFHRNTAKLWNPILEKFQSKLDG
ncbi:uncharacterized mitochondrial protein AtMg01250-like [Hibiscus syriacus]|uniref:uncharacterized mitochondrial protein AtMg01250-like n=1 Tax=Hibiscus syriacus TaxID=106335 RepID=UPI001925113A|nr:uncharacterized mitochondrial protein AtMg01250-like [Hibiscus syriacus]